jgi:single-stranded DNA-binding protein
VATNRAYLIGNVASDAKFEVLKNNTPCLRFVVVVPRGSDQVSAKFVAYVGSDGRLDKSKVPGELKAELKDHLQVVCYGQRAATIAGALNGGRRVAVDGWHEERRFYDREVERFRVVHEINAINIVIARDDCPGVAITNRAYLIGHLEKDPLFEVLRGSVPCLRMKVRVARSPRQVSAELAPYALENGLVNRTALPRELRGRLSDSLAVVVYGQRALLYSKYLRKHAQVAVDGWSEERHYHDREVKRERRIQEINAAHIVCGPGSDFDAGEAYRQRMIAEADERGLTSLEELGLQPVEMSYGDLEGYYGHGN